jgi:hypothetical protein
MSPVPAQMWAGDEPRPRAHSAPHYPGIVKHYYTTIGAVEYPKYSAFVSRCCPSQLTMRTRVLGVLPAHSRGMIAVLQGYSGGTQGVLY